MKSYSVNGKEYTLAEPTARRIDDFAKLVGVDDLLGLSDSLSDVDGQKKVGLAMLSVVLKPEQVSKAMQICLINHEDEDWSNVPVKVTKQIVSDFFTGLAASLN